MPSQSPCCVLCGQTDAEVIYEAMAPQRFGASDPVFGLVRCRGCGLTFLSPRPDPAEMGAYYPNSYYLSLSPGTASLKKKSYLRRIYNYYSPSYYYRIRSQLAIVRRQCGERVGKVLDIGVGDGCFLEHMRELGWQVEGTDFSPEAARRTSERLGGNTIHVGQIEHLDLNDHGYDLVTLWDVLEHLYQPLDTLRRVHSLLKPGGVLLVNVPNLASLESRLLGRDWGHLDIPRHLFHFTPSSLRKIFETAGFGEVRLTTAYRTLTEHMPRALIPGRSAMDRWTSRSGAATKRVLDDSLSLVLTPLLWMGWGPGLVASGRPSGHDQHQSNAVLATRVNSGEFSGSSSVSR